MMKYLYLDNFLHIIDFNKYYDKIFEWCGDFNLGFILQVEIKIQINVL